MTVEYNRPLRLEYVGIIDRETPERDTEAHIEFDIVPMCVKTAAAVPLTSLMKNGMGLMYIT